MDIMAYNGGFAFGMTMMSEFKYSANKDGSISLVATGKRSYPPNVTTPRGVFLEVLNADGEVIQDGGDGDWFHVQIGKKPVTLRYKQLPDPEMTRAQIEKVRGKTTVTVAHQERYDSGPINFGASYTSGTLLAVINSFQKVLASIPEQYRKKACCEIDSKSGYEGSHSAHVEITYERPETDKEVIGRIQIERERARISALKKRAQFENLKRELEPSHPKT